MDPEIQKLCNVFSRELEKVISFFQSLPKNAFLLSIYSEGSMWTPRQILSHFVESEISLRTLISEIVEEGMEGVPVNFDLDVYNESAVIQYDEWDVRDLITRFKTEREETIRTVGSWEADDLEKQGRHPFLGISTVGEMLKLMYLHHTIHMRDIRKVVNAE